MASSHTASEQTSSARQAEARWFVEEVWPHEPALRAWLRVRFPSLTDIDDLVQETYARLFRARTSGKVTDVRPYLFVIARNAAVDVFRRSQIVAYDPLVETEHASVVEQSATAGEAVSQLQEIELMHEAIAALPERCRMVLTLRKLQGLSYREIAEKLGISENTVDAHVCTGLFRCREYLRNNGVSRERLTQVKAPSR